MFFKKIDQKLDEIYQSFTDSKVSHCEICKTKFSWNKHKSTCVCCGKTICKECFEKFSEPQNSSIIFKICNNCWNTETKKIEDVIVVKSPHVGGHNTIKEIDKIESETWDELTDVETDLKFECYKKGGNTVLNFRYKKITKTGLSDRNRTYYYNAFQGFGVAAVVEPYKNRKKKPKT